VALTILVIGLAARELCVLMQGAFQGFQTSGPLFDSFAKAVKEMLNLDIKVVGVIKVDEVYSAAPPNPGARIA
jgi:hypothetical protein